MEPRHNNGSYFYWQLSEWAIGICHLVPGDPWVHNPTTPSAISHVLKSKRAPLNHGVSSASNVLLRAHDLGTGEELGSVDFYASGD